MRPMSPAKPCGRPLDQLTPQCRGSQKRIADDSAGVQIRRHPGPRRRPVRRQALGKAHLAPRRFVQRHQLRVQMKHDRGLDPARMPVPRRRARRRKRCRLGQRLPMGLDDEETVLGAKPHGGERDRWGIAAMAVQDQEALQTRRGDGSAKSDPAGGKELRIEGERAGQIAMLRRPADRLQGQGHRLGRLMPLRQRRQDACQDEAVGPRRQMRPMLLGRGHGKDDDRRIAETGDLRRGHLVPLSQHALADPDGAADHDI